MRILCAIGQHRGPELIRRLAAVAGREHELILLHVIDTGPRHEMEGLLRRPGGLRRPPVPPEQNRQIDAAEEAAGQAALDEAQVEAKAAGFSVTTEIQRGRPGQSVVQAAREKSCELVVIWNSEGAHGRPQIGPESVGHSARFLLDHIPCDVLLLREAGK
jgi:nucleotide-binding universal stress UspA family protein